MMSNAHASKLLNLTCGVESVSMPRELYLGLCANQPAADGTVTGEPTVASYERKLVGGSSVSSNAFGAAKGGVISNTQEIQMKTARQAYGATMYWFFLSESIDGKATLWGKVNGDTGLTVGEETVPVFYAGELKASIDVPLA